MKNSNLSMKRMLVVVIATFYVFVSVWSQESAQETANSPTLDGLFDPLSESIPTNPTVASMLKYGDVPVDLFSGRVNIDIPIYTLEIDDLSIPISFNYHGGGIKVTEEDGPIGLGWILNVGGVISRNLCGMPDEMNTPDAKGYDNINERIIGHETKSQRREFLDRLKRETIYTNPPMNSYYFKESQWETIFESYVYGEQYCEGHYDTSPDTYSLSCMGMSGVFFLDGLNTTIQSDQELYLRDNSNGFEVKDRDGYTYIFDHIEYATFYYRTGQVWSTNWCEENPEMSYEYPSNWWLSKIKTPTGDSIVFEYETLPNVPTNTWLNKTHLYYKKYHDIEDEADAAFGLDFTFSNLLSPCRQSQPYNKTFLKKIKSKHCDVTFNYTYTDLVGTLNSIQVNANDDYNVPLKTVQLLQSYSFKTPSGKKRLRLDSVKLIGSDQVNFEKYKFGYDLRNFVPDYQTTESDHWGYFNSSVSEFFPSPVNYYGIYKHNGANNRSSSIEDATAGMLTHITYPTGGTTELIWEPNTYSSLGGPFANQVDEDFDNDIDNSSGFQKTRVVNNGTRAQTIHITHKQILRIDFSKYYDGLFYSPNEDGCITGWEENDTVFEYLIKLPYLLITSPDKKKNYIRANKNSIMEWNSEGVPFVADQKGRYEFRLINVGEEIYSDYAPCVYARDLINGVESGPSQCRVTIHYDSVPNQYSSSKTRYTGGVRIQRVVNRTNDGGEEAKLYDYSEDGIDPSAPSSGVLVHIPRYSNLLRQLYTIRVHHVNAYTYYDFDTELVYLNSNPLPQVLNGGYHVEYKHVTEHIIDNRYYSQNRLNPDLFPRRRVEYVYRTSVDDLGIYGDIDETQYDRYVASNVLKLTSQRYKRGDLIRKSEYTDELKITNYDYEVLENTDVDTLTGNVFTVTDYSEMRYSYSRNETPETASLYKDFGIVKYRIIPYNKRLRSKQQTSDNTLNNWESYTYFNDTYEKDYGNTPRTYSYIGPAGDTLTNYYTYTHPDIVAKRKIRTCMTVKQDKVVAAYRNEYNDIGLLTHKYIAEINSAQQPNASGYINNNLLRPDITPNSLIELTSRLIERHTYRNNKLAQLEINSDEKTVLIWSYKGAYPVAKITNASYNEVVDALGGEPVLSSLYNTYTPNMTLLDALRNELPNSHVNTYTHKLLVGMTSHTDPRGFTTYYTYDGLGRLVETYIIEQGCKRVVQKHDYHYRD